MTTAAFAQITPEGRQAVDADPLACGWVKSNLGTVLDLTQQFTDGYVSPELVGVIQIFQTVHDTLTNIDLRADSGDATWPLLIQTGFGTLPCDSISLPATVCR
jgi:hypothetical protein